MTLYNIDYLNQQLKIITCHKVTVTLIVAKTISIFKHCEILSFCDFVANNNQL